MGNNPNLELVKSRHMQNLIKIHRGRGRGGGGGGINIIANNFLLNVGRFLLNVGGGGGGGV